MPPTALAALAALAVVGGIVIILLFSLKIQHRSAKIFDVRNRLSTLLSGGDARAAGAPECAPKSEPVESKQYKKGDRSLPKIN